MSDGGTGAASSELRQRRVRGTGTHASSGQQPVVGAPVSAEGVQEDNADAEHEAIMQDFMPMLATSNSKKVSGLSDAAKKIKDQLADDPYNLELIWQLGQAYEADERLDRVFTVLTRGWKRVDEFEDRETRFKYLGLLSTACVQEKKFRQALAVLNDIEGSEGEDASVGFEMLKCQVYCFNDEVHKGLRAFNKAIDGQDFESIRKIWSVCIPAIKQAGGYEIAKTVVEDKAANDKQRQKLEAIARLVELKDALTREQERKSSMKENPRLKWIYGSLAFFVLFFFYALYQWERASLRRHGLILK